jgi:hypothetical protein
VCAGGIVVDRTPWSSASGTISGRCVCLAVVGGNTDGQTNGILIILCNLSVCRRFKGVTDCQAQVR